MKQSSAVLAHRSSLADGLEVGAQVEGEAMIMSPEAAALGVLKQTLSDWLAGKGKSAKSGKLAEPCWRIRCPLALVPFGRRGEPTSISPSRLS
jgi:hypothetical protein